MSNMTISNMSFRVGQTMTIVGVPKTNDTEFKVNICPNNNAQDVALHIKPCFSARHGDNMVVYNARQGGQWGKELIEGGIPFNQEQNVKIVIEFTHAWFLVSLSAVDGDAAPPKFKFPNRLGVDKCTFHFFEKGVRIQSIEIK